MVRDLEKDLFDLLSMGPRHISDLVLKLRCRKESLLKIIEKHENKQLQVETIGNKKVISITPHNLEQEHELLVGTMKLHKDIVYKYLIPQLKQKKPIFKITEQTKTTLMYWVNPKARNDMNNVIGQLDQIMQFSFNLAYEDALDLVPKDYQDQVKKDQKLCIKTMKYIIDELKKVVGKKNELALRSFMHRKTRILRKLEA